MDLNLKLKKDAFPILFKLKKKELNKISDVIFKTGYDIMYPQISETNIKEKKEYNELINKLDELKKDLLSPQLNDKIASLESSLEKLIGISCNSSKKGDFAENVLETIITKRYGDITYKKTNTIPHSGDAWIYLPDDKIIMVESKNYNTTVNKDELIKMENDMKTNNILWGLFVSFNSNIQGLKEMDYHTFTHNNQIYNIIAISNLSNDINRLDLGLTIVRKLINMPNSDTCFPWIIKNIKSDLNDLNDIIKKNYIIRDNFINMEKEINKQLNSHYIKLRDYQFEEENKINEIIKNINSTMEKSIDIELDNKYDEIQDYCNEKDKKLGITKKITFEISKYELIVNFVVGKDKENIINLSIIENILK